MEMLVYVLCLKRISSNLRAQLDELLPQACRGPGDCRALVQAEYLTTIWNHMTYCGIELDGKHVFSEQMRPWHYIVAQDALAYFQEAFQIARRGCDNTKVKSAATFHLERL